MIGLAGYSNIYITRFRNVGMPYCFECGGKLIYDREIRLYTCQTCGFTYNSQELLVEREKRFNSKFEEERRRRRREEYLEWWLSSKS